MRLNNKMETNLILTFYYFFFVTERWRSKSNKHRWFKSNTVDEH